MQKHTAVRNGSKYWVLCPSTCLLPSSFWNAFGPYLHEPFLFPNTIWCWTQTEERSHQISPGTTGCSIICLSCSSRSLFSPCQVRWIKQEELLRSLLVCSLFWCTPSKHLQPGKSKEHLLLVRTASFRCDTCLEHRGALVEVRMTKDITLTEQMWQMIPFQNLFPRLCHAWWNAPAAGQTAAGILRENRFQVGWSHLLQWTDQ